MEFLGAQRFCSLQWYSSVAFVLGSPLEDLNGAGSILQIKASQAFKVSFCGDEVERLSTIKFVQRIRWPVGRESHVRMALRKHDLLSDGVFRVVLCQFREQWQCVGAIVA